ncbi:hypothetical protein [Neobacillus niacini]
MLMMITIHLSFFKPNQFTVIGSLKVVIFTRVQPDVVKIKIY